MKKFDTKRVEMFLEFKKASKDTVFNLFVFNLFVLTGIYVLGYDFFKSFLILLPFCVIDCVIFIIFKLIKKTEDTIVNVFCGIEGLLLAMILQSALFIILPITFKVASFWLSISLIVNIIVAIAVNVFSLFYIRGEKSMVAKPVSVAVISASSVLGITIGRQINSENAILVVFVIFSAVASVLSVYFLKYKLQKMLERKT